MSINVPNGVEVGVDFNGLIILTYSINNVVMINPDKLTCITFPIRSYSDSETDRYKMCIVADTCIDVIFENKETADYFYKICCRAMSGEYKNIKKVIL